jgi:hypothetical protein
VSQGLRIIKRFPQEKLDKPQRKVVEEVVDKLGAWAYFDGATQGETQICCVGRALFLNDSHCLKFKVGLGKGTNNDIELMSLKCLLSLVGEKGVSKIQSIW